MSESFENADCSFTFDTSLSAEFDLTIYAGIIYELAVVTPQRKKIKNEEFIPDLEILDSDHDDIEQDDVDMNQTHLTNEFNQIFSYFDEDVEELNDGSDEEINQFHSDFKEFSDKKIDNQIDVEIYEPSDIENDYENSSDNFQCKIEGAICKIDNVFKAKQELLPIYKERSNKIISNDDRLNNKHSPDEIISNDDQSSNDLYNKLTNELGVVGNVKEKVLMYNKMLEEIEENLELEKKKFRKKIEENVTKENSLIDCYSNMDDVDNTIASDFELLSKYVNKLSSIESYALIINRLNRLVNAISQLDKTRLNGMNLKSLKNFLYFIKIYSYECVNISSSIRKDIAKDLEKKLLTNEDLLYCLDIVAKEVNQVMPD